MRPPLEPNLKEAHSPAIEPACLWRGLLAVAILWAAGCANQPVPSGSHWVVSTPKAQFYKNGPAEQFSYIEPTFDQNIAAQAVGPDFELPKGTHLTMLKHEFGFSRMVTEDGVVGYVSNDQVSSAPAMTRVMRPAAQNPETRSYRAPPRTGNPRPRKFEAPDPGLDLNDVPLPQP